MDNKKFGLLIADLRKKRGFTQKDLAQQLNVSDKAISKWERGLGYPEITTVPELAKILNISVSELLSCEQDLNEDIKPVSADTIANNTIIYADKAIKYKNAKISHTFLTILSLFFIVAIFVCLLCNYAISQTFNWSLYPTGAIILAWFTISPALYFKKHKIVLCLSGLTISLFPFLYLIQNLTPAKGWLLTLALPIAIVSLVFIWLLITLFIYSKINKWYLSALAVFLLGVVLNLVVNQIVENFVAEVIENNISTMITVLSFSFVSIVLAVVGVVKRKR